MRWEVRVCDLKPLISPASSFAAGPGGYCSCRDYEATGAMLMNRLLKCPHLTTCALMISSPYVIQWQDISFKTPSHRMTSQRTVQPKMAKTRGRSGTFQACRQRSC